MINKLYITPALLQSIDLTNQFAYLPTRSTTAALISLLTHITNLLETNSHVYVITFDYSKAFDTLSHWSVATVLAQTPLPYNCYNWVLDYLFNRSQYTLFSNKKSAEMPINTGVIQGSVLGPVLFNAVSSTLKPASPLNKYFKYADDGYLVVPGSNRGSIQNELTHHSQWAASHNLKLNPDKTCEIVFSKKNTTKPPLNLGVERVSTLRILGVTVDENLNFKQHIENSISSCSSTFFALRTLKQFGAKEQELQLVFRAKIVSKLLYGSLAWWGFITKALINRLETFLRRAIKYKYYPSESSPTIAEIVDKQEKHLFKAITQNKSHCLHHLLPELKEITYSLRPRGHYFSLPTKNDKLFISRCLYKYRNDIS